MSALGHTILVKNKDAEHKINLKGKASFPHVTLFSFFPFLFLFFPFVHSSVLYNKLPSLLSFPLPFVFIFLLFPSVYSFVLYNNLGLFSSSRCLYFPIPPFLPLHFIATFYLFFPSSQCLYLHTFPSYTPKLDNLFRFFTLSVTHYRSHYLNGHPLFRYCYWERRGRTRIPHSVRGHALCLGHRGREGKAVLQSAV